MADVLFKQQANTTIMFVLDGAAFMRQNSSCLIHTLNEDVYSCTFLQTDVGCLQLKLSSNVSEFVKG